MLNKSSHVEVEKKVMLKDFQYRRILADEHIAENSIVKQVNSYYKNNLNDLLRVRKFTHTDDYLLTHKHWTGSELLENEVWTTKSDLEKDLADFAKNEGLEDISYIGNLETYRVTIKKRYGILCIDKNVYLGKTDYELEFELYDPDISNFEEFYYFIVKHNIPLEMGKLSKYQRFSEELAKKND